MIKNKNAEEESNKPPPPDPSVFRGKSGTDCQCSSVVECGENDRFLLLTADGDGRVKLWNGETKRNVWTVSDDDDDDDDENTTNDPKRKVSSILAIEIVEDCKESDRYKFLTHERDGTVCLWVSTPTENEEKEEDIFPPKRWRRKPMLKQVLETESECHTFCPMSNVITTVSSLEEEKKRGVVVARPASERGAVELVSVDLEGGRMTSKPILLKKREKVTTGEGSEEGGEEEEDDNEKYGSVSALKFLSRRTLMVGYESGHMTVVRTDEGDFLDAGSSNSNVHLSNNTQRCFKDMVTCIDSYVQRKNDEEDENINRQDRMHVVAIGCAGRLRHPLYGNRTLHVCARELFTSVCLRRRLRRNLRSKKRLHERSVSLPGRIHPRRRLSLLPRRQKTPRRRVLGRENPHLLPPKMLGHRTLNAFRTPPRVFENGKVGPNRPTPRRRFGPISQKRRKRVTRVHSTRRVLSRVADISSERRVSNRGKRR